MTRRPMIAGNWKMHKLQGEAVELFNGIKEGLREYTIEQLPEVVVAPVFTSISAVVAQKTDCGCGCKGKKSKLQLKTATMKLKVLLQVKFQLKWQKMQAAN